MITRRRWVEIARFANAIAVLLGALGANSVEALEVTLLVEKLPRISSVIVYEVERSKSRTELCFAEARSGLVRRFSMSENGFSLQRERLETASSGPAILARLEANSLLIGADRLRAHWAKTGPIEPDPFATADLEAARGPIVGLATNSRFVFAVAGEELFRARHASGRVTALAKSAESDATRAITFDAKGYLLALRYDQAEGESPNWRIDFLDPENPEAPIASTRVTGLTNPIGLVHSRSIRTGEPLLFALAAGGGEGGLKSGVYRIDAAPPEGPRLKSNAVLVAEIEQPTALAAGPDGSLYAATLTDGGSGVLLLLRDEDQPGN